MRSQETMLLTRKELRPNHTLQATHNSGASLAVVGA